MRRLKAVLHDAYFSTEFSTEISAENSVLNSALTIEFDSSEVAFTRSWFQRVGALPGQLPNVNKLRHIALAYLSERKLLGGGCLNVMLPEYYISEN
jgi:hypothetical protein